MKNELERIRDQLKCSLNMGGVKGSAEWAVGEIDRLLVSLPMGVPDGFREARVVGFKPGMGEVTLYVGRLPAWLDMGHTCYVSAAPAAPTVKESLSVAPTFKAEQPDMAEAYVGAREDLAIWKRRALEAEQKVRHQEQVIDHLTLEAQGETRFGEPSIPSAEPVAVIEYAGYDPANSIKWLNKGLQYLEPGTLLYAQAPSLPAAGSAGVALTGEYHADVNALLAQIAERDAAIEKWSGTAVQNGMEVDRLIPDDKASHAEGGKV